MPPLTARPLPESRFPGALSLSLFLHAAFVLAAAGFGWGTERVLSERTADPVPVFFKPAPKAKAALPAARHVERRLAPKPAAARPSRAAAAAAQRSAPVGDTRSVEKATDQATATLGVSPAQAALVGEGNDPPLSAGDSLDPGSEPQAAELTAAYLVSVRDRLERHKRYPYLLKRQGIQGTVVVRFVIGTDGTPRGIRASNGSSHPFLLEAALEAVNAAAPFAPPPAGLPPEVPIEVPMAFVLADE